MNRMERFSGDTCGLATAAPRIGFAAPMNPAINLPISGESAREPGDRPFRLAGTSCKMNILLLWGLPFADRVLLLQVERGLQLNLHYLAYHRFRAELKS